MLCGGGGTTRRQNERLNEFEPKMRILQETANRKKGNGFTRTESAGNAPDLRSSLSIV